MMRRQQCGQAVGLAGVVVCSLWLGGSAAAQPADGRFDRTLTVSGAVNVSVRSGSGSIRVVPGAGGTVKIAATIRADSSWFGTSDVKDRIRRIEQHPPIVQQGGAIRIGEFDEPDMTRNLSISYHVTVPSATEVTAKTGSGSIEIGDLTGSVDAGSGSGEIVVGRVAGAVEASAGSGSIRISGAGSVRASTGSGGIDVRDVAGPMTARSGSGSVVVSQTGKGDVDLSAASGGVTARGINGAARVSSASGTVRLEGRPAGPWNVSSASGGISIEVPSDAAFDLDARSNSGSIETDLPVTVQGSLGRHRLSGQIRGGGVRVELRTSSGGIRIR